MTKTPILLSPPESQQGFTLVELMISMVISLVLLLFVSSLFISSKGSYRLNDDNARMQEDGRYAMGLIGRNLMQAGFGNPVTSTTTDFVGEDAAGNSIPFVGVDAAGNPIPVLGLKGCENGFVSPVAATPNFDCATAGGQPGFQVSYRAAGLKNDTTGEGTDCNGQSVDDKSKLPYIPGIASNRFFLHTKDGTSSLYCNGSGGPVSQPVLSNVEDMVLTYGTDTNGTFVPDKYLNADDVEALPPNDYIKNWNQVISVQVCLLISSENNVTPQTQPYTMCPRPGESDGDEGPNKDRKLRRKITSVFTLRNNAAPSLVD